MLSTVLIFINKHYQFCLNINDLNDFFQGFTLVKKLYIIALYNYPIILIYEELIDVQNLIEDTVDFEVDVNKLLLLLIQNVVGVCLSHAFYYGKIKG